MFYKMHCFSNRCVALDDTKAFHFATTYKGLLSNVKGGLWCIRTGIMVAAKFSVVGGSNKLFLKINYGFCTQSTETLCDDVSFFWHCYHGYMPIYVN